MNYTKYPQACKALMAFMMEADQFNPWMEAAQGYASHCLNAYDSNPVWTKDPKRAVYRDAFCWCHRSSARVARCRSTHFVVA
jgi:multiple sugar transport system substrate-binding protein